MAGYYFAPGQTTEDLRREGRLPAAPVAAPSELATKVKSNLSSALAGQLPQDVIDQIATHAAEFGVASGMPGSQFAQYRGLRDLGLTSLNRMDQATQTLLPYVTRSPYQPNMTGLPPEQGRANWWQPGGTGEVSAPMLAPRGGQPSVGDELAKYLTRGGGAAKPDYSSTFSSLAQRFNPGMGMAPMGSGTIPNAPFNWNAGPLTVGGGNMFMGDPNQLSPEELFAYGLDQPVPEPMTADDSDYLYGPA